MAQVCETVDFKIVRGEMAKLEPRWATGTFLGRTDESDEVIVEQQSGSSLSFRRRTRDEQWQRDAFTTFMSVPWNPRGLAVEGPMASSRRRYITKSLVQQHGEAVQHAWEFHRSTHNLPRKIRAADHPNATEVIQVIPSAVGDPSPASDAASTEQRHATQPDTSKHVRQAVGMSRGAEDNRASPEKPPNEKVISTKMFHKAKGHEVRSRIVAREYPDLNTTQARPPREP